MNIVLRILVILTLIVNGVALWFATALYGKRELLIDRDTAYYKIMPQIARTLEADEPQHENTAASHEARDISDVTAANADITPDKSDFWESYKEEYEDISRKNYSIDDRQSDLNEVYVTRPDENGNPQVVLDGKGDKVTEGSPQDNLLQEILGKAKAQRARLNNVRGELAKVRRELEDAIQELNAVKRQGRESLKTIDEKNEEIAGLESKVAALEGEIESLKQNIQSLEDDKAALQADLDKKTEELETAQAEIAKLKETIEKFAKLGGTKATDGLAAVANIPAGVKGKVVRVDNDYNFCVVELTDEALAELIGEDQDRPLPEAEFYIRRPGNTTSPIGKVRLRSLTKSVKAVVCDILVGWKQEDVKKGDEVFYLD